MDLSQTAKWAERQETTCIDYLHALLSEANEKDGTYKVVHQLLKTKK